jgi:hypothetical protein
MRVVLPFFVWYGSLRGSVGIEKIKARAYITENLFWVKSILGEIYFGNVLFWANLFWECSILGKPILGKPILGKSILGMFYFGNVLFWECSILGMFYFGNSILGILFWEFYFQTSHSAHDKSISTSQLLNSPHPISDPHSLRPTQN